MILETAATISGVRPGASAAARAARPYLSAPTDVAELLRRYFQRGVGSNSGLMRVSPDLGRMLQFRAFNLIDAKWDLGEPFDVVFCRNVMIYFDEHLQARVHGLFHDSLRRFGILALGRKESLAGTPHQHDYEELDAAEKLFRRRGGG